MSRQKSSDSLPGRRHLMPVFTRQAVHEHDEVSISPETIAKAKVSHLPSGERWFAVQCQPHREPVAANQLRDQGFLTWAGMVEETGKRKLSMKS